MKHKLKFSTSSTETLTIVLEPWGEEFEIARDQDMIVVFDGNVEALRGVEVRGQVLVVSGGIGDRVSVKIAGQTVNRPMFDLPFP